MQNFSDFIMKCAIFEEHSSSCVVYSRFSGTLFPVSMIDGGTSVCLSFWLIFVQPSSPLPLEGFSEIWEYDRFRYNILQQGFSEAYQL